MALLADACVLPIFVAGLRGLSAGIAVETPAWAKALSLMGCEDICVEDTVDADCGRLLDHAYEKV